MQWQTQSAVPLWAPSINALVLADQEELIYSSFVGTKDLVWRICVEWLMIGIDEERSPGKSMQLARNDYDDDGVINMICKRIFHRLRTF